MQQSMRPIDNLLENTLMQLERTTERIMNRIAITMQAPMQKSVFHLVSLLNFLLRL
jgi:hypothetical protein